MPRYYQVESRALEGLLSACEAKPKGRTVSADQTVAKLQQANQRLQRELTRNQSLARAAQRTLGWLPPVTPAKSTASAAGKTSNKTRRRRTARALSIAERLQTVDPVAPAAVPPTPPLGV